jgi:hypothetical protein
VTAAIAVCIVFTVTGSFLPSKVENKEIRCGRVASLNSL